MYRLMKGHMSISWRSLSRGYISWQSSNLMPASRADGGVRNCVRELVRGGVRGARYAMNCSGHILLVYMFH
jgi:hypothetical protein